MYRLDWDGKGEIQFRQIPGRVPINSEEFSSDLPEHVDGRGFRVADLLVHGQGRDAQLFATHHYWKGEDRCFVVRVSSLPLADVLEGSSDQAGEWETVFESRPCLPFKTARGAPFAGVQIGGNLETLTDDEILLTVGDHQFDGWYGSPNYVEDMSSDYGKTVVIDLTNGEMTRMFTSGHRNAQGLVIDGMGRIWSTEHGPEGGDELNLLREGNDYGWPSQTYGTEYGSVTWPPGERSDTQRSATEPVFAWLPSIGISEVVAVEDTVFAAWRGDLLVASLVGRAIWRVRLAGDRVAYTEPIDVGRRIRDMVSEGGRGELVLWTDSESIIRLVPARDLDEGAAVFAVRCGGCHDDQENRIGPTLKGVAGSPVASRPGYDYSAALERLGGRWTDERLDAFIADPDSLVPGTAMQVDGVADSATRRALIAYLKTLN